MQFVGHDTAENVQVHGIRVDIDRAPGCAKVVVLVGLDKVDVPVFTRDQDRGFILVHDNAEAGLGVGGFQGAGDIGDVRGLGADIPVELVGDGCEDRLIRLDGAGVESIRTVFQLGTFTYLCRQAGEYVRDAGNALLIEDVSANIIIPQIQCGNVDSVLDTCAQLDTLVAFVALVNGVCRRRIHGRLVDEPDSLFEFAIQDIQSNFQCDGQTELRGCGKGALCLFSFVS